MADKGWHRAFDDPIPLPGGGKLVTLRDAAHYITGLPKAEQHAERWQTATKLLLLIGENGGDLLRPRIAMMKALHRNMPRSASAQRRKRTKGVHFIR